VVGQADGSKFSSSIILALGESVSTFSWCHLESYVWSWKTTVSRRFYRILKKCDRQIYK
jgi:hypothetical protein